MLSKKRFQIPKMKEIRVYMIFQIFTVTRLVGKQAFMSMVELLGTTCRGCMSRRLTMSKSHLNTH